MLKVILTLYVVTTSVVIIKKTLFFINMNIHINIKISVTKN